MRGSGQGGLGMVLAGVALGAAITLGALWATGTEVADLLPTRPDSKRSGSRIPVADQGRLRRPLSQEDQIKELEGKILRYRASCSREFPEDELLAYSCVMTLSERAGDQMLVDQHATIESRLDRAQRDADAR